MSSYRVRQERQALLRRLRLRRRVERTNRRNYEYELAKLSAENNAIRRETASEVFAARSDHGIRWNRNLGFAAPNTPMAGATDGRLRMLCNTLRMDQRSLERPAADWREWMTRRVADDLAKTLVKDGLLTVEWPSEDAMRRAEYGNERHMGLGGLSVRWAFYVAPVPMANQGAQYAGTV